MIQSFRCSSFTILMLVGITAGVYARPLNQKTGSEREGISDGGGSSDLMAYSSRPGADSGEAAGSSATDVAGRGFPASNVTLVYQMSLSQIPGSGSSANDVWGYVSPSGREYAILGLSAGTAFIDITSLSRPILVASIPDSSSIWSDMTVLGHYAYNVNESSGGMQIFDLDQIDNGVVALVGSLTASGLSTAHNVHANPDSGYIYIVGSNVGGGLLVADASDPSAPVLVGSWNGAGVHDVYVTTYTSGPFAGREIAFAFAGGAGVKIVDVTDKANMFTRSTLVYPNLRFCHQGWPSEDLQYLFIDDELDELQDPDVTTTTTYIADISDLDNPLFLTSFTNGLASIDHNLMIRGDFVYEANYTSGLRVYDASDINNVSEVGYFDTFPANDSAGFSGAWGVFTDFPSGHVVVSDMSGGLFVLDVSAITGQLSSPFPPLPENSLGNTACMLDTDCANEAYCVADESGAFPGTCYVPKNRYLSVAPNAANDVPTARRLSVATFERSCGGAGVTPCTTNAECAGNQDGPTCDDVRVGSQVIGWFGQPDADGFASIVDEANRQYVTWVDLSFPMECGVDEMCPPNSHCDLGVGAGNTCKWDADDTEVSTSVVQLTGCHIAPKMRAVGPSAGENRAANYYLIEAIAEGSDIANQFRYSMPLELRTVVFWGDMTGGTQDNLALPPDNATGFLDILEQVNRFKERGKAATPQLDLDPQEPDRSVGFVDMLAAVTAFKDQPYPWDDPCTCAGLAPCN